MESAGTFVAVLTPLFAVPLTLIVFYLRSLREHQTTWHTDSARRVESMESSVADIRRLVAEFERDYTTKEEWLRECMHARRTLEQLTQTTIRIETLLENTSLTTTRTSRAERRGRRGARSPVTGRPGQFEDGD